MSVELGSVEIFSALTAPELTYLRARMARIGRKAGELLFSEGDPGEELFVVLRGRVSVTVKLAGGAELPISEIGTGSFFGEMCIIERTTRSASCRCVEDAEFLCLTARDFESLIAERSDIAVKIMRRMLEITVSRLAKTSGFLSQLVQWGDAARKRAVTDEATGLFNRRFHDESLESLFRRAELQGESLSYAMFDLDRFGTLNREHGLAFGDAAILAVARCMREAFLETDILVRYGGDEFVFILPGADAAAAHVRAERLRALVASARVEGHPDVPLSCSLGVASFPEHGRTTEELAAAADKALYRAKETGRNRVMVAGDLVARSLKKRDFRTIRARNVVIANIIAAADTRDDFLLIGHQNPDEDCTASLVAFALILVKMQKRATIYLRRPMGEQYGYLLSICSFNSIRIAHGEELAGLDFPVVVALDTPKPSMLDVDEATSRRIFSPDTLRIELDHHLEGDAEYFGDEGYRLVTGASSTCELIGFLAFKLERDPVMVEKYALGDLFSRNLVLALLTGIISDSRMGAYLNSRRDRRLYLWLTESFDRMLAEKTKIGSGKFSSKEELFSALETLSSGEEKCFRAVMEARRKSPRIDWAVLNAESTAALRSNFGEATLISGVKSAADAMAEENGYLSMVAYPEERDRIQFRIRRDRTYAGVDLRELLETLKLEDGGGHPGAVGFRLKLADVPDLAARAEELAAEISAAVEAAEVSSDAVKRNPG